jgi:hypothetical protein
VASARPHGLEPREDVRVHGHGLAADLGDRLTGEVVRRWAEAARGDHELRPAERGPDRLDDDCEVVRQVGDPRHGHAVGNERTREVPAVGVDRLADRQLGADREQLGAEDGAGG